MKNFKERMLNVGITQKKLAELTIINRSVISQFYTNDRTMNKFHSKAIDKVLTAYEEAIKNIRL